MANNKTIRQAVFSDKEVGLTAIRLQQLVDIILAAKEHIVELETNLKYDTAVKDAKQAVADLEVEVAYDVFNDLNGDGKKQFTNEAKRKDETRRRLLRDDDWVTAQNIVANTLRAEAALKMDLGKAHARLCAIECENHNLRSIAGMIAGLAHESTTQERIHRHTTTVRIGENHVQN